MPRRRNAPSFDKETREGHTAQIVVFLTAILAGSGTLVSQYPQLPWWWKSLLALFTSISVIVLVTQFLWPPLGAWLAELRESLRLNAISQTVLPEFEDIVRRFQELIN